MNPNGKTTRSREKTSLGVSFLLTVLSLVYRPSCYALSFARNNIKQSISLRQQYRTSRNQVTTVQVQQNSSQDLKDVVSSEDSIFSQAQDTELWLDLRRTAFHPKAAIDELETQLGRTIATTTSSSSSSPPLVDRILLSEKVFQNLVDFNDPYLAAIPILYQSSKNDDIFSSSSKGLSTPFGCIISTPSDMAVPVEDLFETIEMITDGKWLLLGKEEGKDNPDDHAESMRIESVGNFLDIVSTAAAPEAGMMWSSSNETNGLVLPTTGTQTTTLTENDTDLQQEDDEPSTRIGGVAVTCSTKSAIIKLASTLQMMAKPGEMNSVTDSGIIFESSGDTSPSSSSSSSLSSASLGTAVVIPFAIDLWEIGTLMFGKEELFEKEEE
jgi:hypothetical protein